MKSFSEIEALALAHAGSTEVLESQLSTPKATTEIQTIPDHLWLSDITKSIFQAGFNWKVVEDKWLNFEYVFHQFDVGYCASLADEALENTLKEEGIIRNWMKIKTIRENALFFSELIKEHGSLGNYFASWQPQDYCSNIQFLAKQGSRLGGKTAQLSMRRMGVDSLILTNDVVTALVREGVIEKIPSSKKAWTATQEAMNIWMQESGRSMNEISKILALSVGKPCTSL